jgi:hypothetical protein
MAVTKLSLYDQIKGIAAGGTSAAGDMFVVSDTVGTITKASSLTYIGTTLTATTFSGSLTGNVTGNCSGSAGSVTWANVSGKPTIPVDQDGARYSTDFNTILTTGFYNAEATPSNAPNAYGQLIVARGLDTGFQIYGGYTSDNLYFRGWQSSGSSFTTWRTVVHSGNIGSQSVSAATTATNANNLYVTTPGASTYSLLFATGSTGNQAAYYAASSALTYSSITAVLSTGGIAASAAITSTGEITAFYSDERLKENIRPIEDALTKILSISGIKYNANLLAKSFGYTTENQVGLIAQEVQKVLPEAVVLAPFDRKEDGTSKSGKDFLTIKYEKLVPLLVEAIKELNEKIKKLENK